MPTTEHIHLPLYTDEETPDLSTTGHYNHAMEIIDANVGELEAKDAELAEDIADEREARIEADSALEAKLSAETKARTDADAALDTAYKAADSALEAKLSAETKARTDADASLDTAYKAADSALEAKLSAETKARTDADAALDTAYKAADSALGSRIDNAETEISANSADLTGIKGLTYGEGGQVFLENENGSYSSPALVEIRNEISNLQSQGGGISADTPWAEIEQS